MHPKAKQKIRPTGVERPWMENEIIVSKTNIKGHIIYANEIFLRVAQMTEEEALGKPHNIIRHPDMPRCVFKLLWENLETGKEIFAFVNNMAMSGDHYWVFAHVTPSTDNNGHVVNYHSNRRKPSAAQIGKIEPIYKMLSDEERKSVSPKDGLEASTALLHKLLKDNGVSYDEFVFSL